MTRQLGPLLAYIPYFQDPGQPFCQWVPPPTYAEGALCFAYPVYDETLSRFITEAANSGLMRTDYLEALKGMDPAGFPALVPQPTLSC